MKHCFCATFRSISQENDRKILFKKNAINQTSKQN